MLFEKHTLVKHVKTDTVYRIIGTPDDGYTIEYTGKPAYVYQLSVATNSPLWIRPQSEMEDGRFISVGISGEM